jgi:hypothetical protein
MARKKQRKVTRRPPAKVKASPAARPRPTPRTHPARPDASRARAREGAVLPPPPAAFDKLAVMAVLCSVLIEGGTVREFCRREGMPAKTTVYDWIDNDPEVRKLFERAQEIGNRDLLDQYKETAFNTEEGERTEVENVTLTAGKKGDEVELPAEKVRTITEDMLGHRKHKCEAILKLLARRDPAKYGARVDLKHTGTLTLENLVAGSMEPEATDAGKDKPQ